MYCAAKGALKQLKKKTMREQEKYIQNVFHGARLTNKTRGWVVSGEMEKELTLSIQNTANEEAGLQTPCSRSV